MADILDRLNEMNESGAIAYDVYSELHNLASQLEERKQGEWILHEENSASSSYHCSVCNRLINVLWSEELSDYPYCHCGAEMKGKNDEMQGL